MSCNSCLSSTRIFFLVILNIILMLAGLIMIGATGFYSIQISKKLAVNTYIGCGVGLVTFLFPMFIVCGGYASRCFLIFNNIIMILLTLSECVAVSLYFIPSTVDMVKKILDLPTEYYTWLADHVLIISIVGGSLLAVQFLVVILSGIHATDITKPQDHDIEMPLAQPAEKITYREKATEKYNLNKYREE